VKNPRQFKRKQFLRMNVKGTNDTLTRNLNGKCCALAPNNDQYVLPIAADVIGLSAISQDVRDQALALLV
jgi:hypothetical protein